MNFTKWMHLWHHYHNKAIDVALQPLVPLHIILSSKDYNSLGIHHHVLVHLFQFYYECYCICVWLFSLRISFQFIEVLALAVNLKKKLCLVVLWIHHNLPILLLMALGSFPVSTIPSNAVMDMFAHGFACMDFCRVLIWEWSSWGTGCSHFMAQHWQMLPSSFSKWLYQFIFSSAVFENSCYTMSLPIIVYQLKNNFFSHFGLFVIVSYDGFDLHLPDDWWTWASFTGPLDFFAHYSLVVRTWISHPISLSTVLKIHKRGIMSLNFRVLSIVYLNL